MTGIPSRAGPPSESADRQRGDAGPERAEDGNAVGHEADARPLPSPIVETLRSKGIDPSDPKIRAAISVVVSGWYHRGPLPPAADLAEYDGLRPGTAERIIGWAERQLDHRLTRERITSDRAEDRLDRAQRNALVVAVFGLIVAGLLGYFGSPWVAAVIALISVGGPATATVLSRVISPPTDRRE